MGDRGNIVVRQEKDSSVNDVWFYGHWQGSDLKKTVKSALSKKWRWDDYSYLARIIFDEMTKNNHDEETGFGISCRIQDNEYPILIVDCPAQKVFQIKESALIGGRLPELLKDAQCLGTFEEFIE